MKYRLVEAASSDEVWLEGLRRRVYADLFVATWGSRDEARHARHFSESMRHGHISIIEVGGTPVGMIQLLEDGDTVEIRELQVEPAHQNQGVGTSVLHDVIRDANARGLSLRLSVGLQNENAIRLYERLGFSSLERSETHLHMRYETALRQWPHRYRTPR